MMATHVSRASAAFLIAGALAMGCSHAWDVLEPLPGAGGSTSASSGQGGVGGAGSTTTTTAQGTTTTAQGTGGAASTTTTAQGTGGAVTTSDASSGDASSSASSGTGGGGATAYYGAALAACNSDMNLDIAVCESFYGNGSMDIDFVTDAMTTTRGYIRFDLDGTFAGKTIDAVTLRLTTLSDPATESDSDHSGEIRAVTPFDMGSLGMAQPTPISGVIGADLGHVDLGQDYYWGLPTDLVAPGSSVYLGIETPSDDGVRYWNDHGNVPPLLIVDYH